MNPNLWNAWFPDLPMPEGCTYEMFVAARNVLWAGDDVQDALSYIRELDGLMTAFPEEIEFVNQLLRAKSRELKRLTDAGL